MYYTICSELRTINISKIKENEHYIVKFFEKGNY
jgi:hypothetical protein